MTTTRKVIIAFWIFIVIALPWEFYNYNQSLNKQATDHPVQQHFYFFHTNAPTATAAQVHNGPNVVQTSFTVQPDTPARGSITCSVTLKNTGNEPATSVQVCVRPYRGVSTINIDVGGGRGEVLKDDDPISMLSDWLAFPDLAPGQSSTETDIFLARPGLPTGLNPTPQIIFETAKPSSTSPDAPATPSAPGGTVPPRKSGA
jgi:hypothetical protein